MDVKLEDGTLGKTEKPVKVGDTVTLDICYRGITKNVMRP